MNQVGSHHAGPRQAHITQEAAHWHALQRQGGLGPAQQARFMDWLVASPEHLREYLAIGRVAGELGEAMRAMPIDLEALIAGASAPSRSDNVVALPARRAPPSPAAVRTHAKRLPRIAAAAALLLGVGMAVHGVWPQSGHYVAAHGAPRSFELPDRTVVHLNAESELSTRFSLFQRRVELLRGQASFVVASGRRPFAVHAAGLQVQDIGTTFDVSLWREQARIGVAEGRVRVVSDAGAGRLLADLRAGQSARVDHRDHAVSVSDEDVATMTAWWQRRVVFRDQPLREVADQFNRLNAVHLQIEDAAAGALRLTGNLSGDHVASLRAFLDEQPMLTTTVTGNRIAVSSRAAETGDVTRD
ncbi:FecR family protein [Pseudoxanthomonas wuyuanensis]|uniref:FecR family protein n=1 Tax=Pseudoxanthomonas wuyuanensis TaxID=1073196 RepID=A0A286D5L1_9GAMM|nr:FecR domain-containing protein [Pseudoxanthomonas wuyuanensis]SOD53951.1 FecR family protein [Pseudoxanthomonas wuyuanensis]